MFYCVVLKHKDTFLKHLLYNKLTFISLVCSNAYCITVYKSITCTYVSKHMLTRHLWCLVVFDEVTSSHWRSH